MRLALALLLSIAPAAAAAQTARTVVVYRGDVDAANATRFLETVMAQRDKVIGLHVDVIPSTRDGDYSATLSDGHLVVRSCGLEVIVDGDVPQRALGEFVLDGMYIPKDGGGTHQGVTSVGLARVDEGTVRLNPAVTIVEQPF